MSVARRDHGGDLALSESSWGYCRSWYDAEITRNRQWRQRITEDLPDASKMYDWNVHTQISIPIVTTQLNGFNYCYLIQIILLNMNHLFAHLEVVTSIAIITNYSIQYYPFSSRSLVSNNTKLYQFCIQLNGSKNSTVAFLFAHRKMVPGIAMWHYQFN